MKNVRQNMKGMMASLVNGGAAKNNAFIMRFGEWVVVEFGFTGNASFFFRSTDLPFDPKSDAISATAIRGHIQAPTRSARDPIRMTHHDTGEGDWEYLFAREMGKRGIFPERRSADASPRWPTTASTKDDAGSSAWRRLIDRDPARDARPATQNTTRSGNASGVRFPFGAKQEGELLALCRRLGIVVRDMRKQEGNLLVMLDKAEDTRLTPLLQSYGFQYRPGRGWWFKN
jgi:hypothetical protein